MNIVLYTTNCPKCNVLKNKMVSKNVEFSSVTDVKEMLKKGFAQAPMLEVDGIIMDFVEANNWINNYKTEGE